MNIRLPEPPTINCILEHYGMTKELYKHQNYHYRDSSGEIVLSGSVGELVKWLEDTARIDQDGRITDKTFEQVWEELGDIAIDDDENIEKHFLHFPIGTNKYDIWHWIEDEFNVVLGDII